MSVEIEVPVGHWRVADTSNATFRCPYDERSCIGGDESGDFLCSEDFSGLLCGSAVPTHHIDWVFQDSLQCTERVVVSSIFLPILCLSFVSLFACCKIGKQPPLLTKSTQTASTATTSVRHHTVFERLRKFLLSATTARPPPEDRYQQQILVIETDQARSMNFLHRVKILICVLQVVSSLPSTLHQPFGLYASLLLRVFSHATMPSLQALPWACFPNSMLFSHTQGLRAPDLVEQMAAATVLPLVGMFFTGLFYLLHMEILHLTVTRIRRRAVHRAYTASYGAVLLVLLHYASGGIWQLTAGVLSAPCVDLDPDRVFPNSSLTVMQSDVTVSCMSSRYRTGYLWALVAALLYMLVLPALHGLLVYFYGAQVDTHHLPAAAVTVYGADKRGRSRGATAKSESPSSSSSEDSSGSDNSCKSDNDGAGGHGKEDVESAESAVTQSDHDARAAHCKKDKEKMKAKGKGTGTGLYGGTVALQRAVSKSVLRRRRASLYFSGIALIYQAYTSQCRYWELNALAVRWFYLALLPALFPYPHPGQVFLAIGVTMIFLQRLLAAQPYADADNQRLAVCGAVQVLLLLMCAVAQETGLRGEDFGPGLPILDLVTCLVLLSTPLYFLYLVLWRPQYQHLVAEDATTVLAPRSHRALPSSAASHPRSAGHAHDRDGNSTPQRAPRRGRGSRARASAPNAVDPPSPEDSPPESDLGSPSLRTPDRAPTTSSASLSRSPAGSLLFQHHRDLALCTQETVTYDVLSAEKKARVRFPQIHVDRYGDAGENDVHGEDWESEYSASASESEGERVISAEHKENLSTESGEEDWGALYRPPSRSCKRPPVASRTLFQPPSPDSTPPQSETGEEPAAWDLGDYPPAAKGPPVSRLEASVLSKTPPLRRLPTPLNLRPLSDRHRAGTPTARTDPPPTRSALSWRATRQSYVHETFPAADLVTEEYGAEFSAIAGSAALPVAPDSPRSSPLVSYSLSAGIYPEHVHVECAQSPYTRRNTPLTLRPPPLDVFPAGGYSELAQAPYPYEPQLDYALRDAVAGRSEQTVTAGAGPVKMPMPLSSSLPPASTVIASTPRAAAIPEGILCTPGSATAGNAIQSMFNNRRACTPRSAGKPPQTPSSPAVSLTGLASAAARSVLERTGLASPRSARRATPKPVQLHQLRPGLSLSLLLDAEHSKLDGDDANFPVTADDAALAFDPSAYFSQGEEFAAADGAGQESLASGAETE